MILPLKGSDCLLRIVDPAPGSEPSLVEGLRLIGWALKHEEVDVTNGADQGWSRLLSGAGLRSIKLRLSGMFLGSAGEELLRESAFSGAAFECELTLEQGAVLSGMFAVIEFQFESAINEEATYAATLRSSGPIAIN
jgi:TP901-1 family phage major tail protein